MFSGDHIKFLFWNIQRDLIKVGGGCLVVPIVSYQISRGIVGNIADGMGIVDKANSILFRQFCKVGIVGIPIFVSEHYALLVLKKVGVEIQVRYGDSLRVQSVISASMASYIPHLSATRSRSSRFPRIS